jgi:signal peptidase I
MNFALILFILLVVSAALWFADHFVFRKRRAPDAKEPLWVEYGASFFPVILIVFVLRSFIVEPFKIPSGSMIPTLLVGDFIAVNKYTYGIRLPVINKKIVEMGTPQRGDVVVFRYPPDPSLDYIKRVVGLPGDKVAYQNKRLTINGQSVQVEPNGDYFDAERMFYTPRYTEKLGDVEHSVLIENDVPSFLPHVMQFPRRENCIYNNAGVICEVPPGHYFVMGDNRDNSQDSRVWGFVPDENLVGKAFFVWFNFGDLKRIGNFH